MTAGARIPQNIHVFEDTLAWIDSCAALRGSVEETRARTEIFLPGAVPPAPGALSRTVGRAHVRVTHNRTLQAAGAYLHADAQRRVCVLNFASATNPGGGVRTGSTAQEEALCRCSTLYPCLNTPALRQAYYEFHRARRDTLYTDACIWTPGVTVLKTDTEQPVRLPEESLRTVDVLSCAAPNLRLHFSPSLRSGSAAPAHITEPALMQLHLERARKICTIAANHAADVLILGAHGAGAFRNPPDVVARAYTAVVPEFLHAFEAIEFAVYCPPGRMQNFEAFHARLREAGLCEC